MRNYDDLQELPDLIPVTERNARRQETSQRKGRNTFIRNAAKLAVAGAVVFGSLEYSADQEDERTQVTSGNNAPVVQGIDQNVMDHMNGEAQALETQATVK